VAGFMHEPFYQAKNHELSFEEHLNIELYRFNLPEVARSITL
jgi:hypothetical protein